MQPPTLRTLGSLVILAVASLPARGLVDPLPNTPTWFIQSGYPTAEFGRALAGAGDVDGFDDVIVGAPGYDAALNEGFVDIYPGSSAGPAHVPSRRIVGGVSGAGLGAAVAGAGDVNGDGFKDVIVGAPTSPGGGATRGSALLFLGGVSGLSPAPAWSVTGDQDNGRLGHAVAGAGDVNDDGYDDVLVGSIFYDNGETDEGQVRLYLGSVTGLAPTPAWTFESNVAFAQLFAVAAAGDVNGDGYGDVVVGAPTYNPGGGRAYLFLGSPEGLGPLPDWEYTDPNGCSLGNSVVGAGDVDGDGFDDLLVGSYCHYNGNNYPSGTKKREGRVFLFRGGFGGPASTANWSVAGSQDGGRFGAVVAGAGDVDGDGLADFLIGEPRHENPAIAGPFEGAAYLYLGSPSSPTLAWTVGGDRGNASFGSWVAGAGDTDGDGMGNILVGAPGFTDGQSGEGAAYLFFGPLAWPPCIDLDTDGHGSPASPTCTGGSALDCDDGRASVHPGAVELCDGRDNDCDGATDEGYSFGTCVVGTGPCAVTGVRVCNAGGTTTVCDTPPPPAPSPEICDGIDNDCDGPVDEDLADPDACHTVVASQTGRNLGSAVSGAGDVNGDGRADVLVGEFSVVPIPRVLLYLGSTAGVFRTPDRILSYPNFPVSGSATFFGSVVAAAGDLDNDGFDDLMVGAPNHSNDFCCAKGAAYIYRGGSSGTPSLIRAILGDTYGAELGTALASAGDVNHDGRDDILVAAPGRSLSGLAYLRTVYLYSGADVASGGPIWTVTETSTFRLGKSVASAGDVDGDLLGDVIIGAPSMTTGQAGRIDLYRGLATNLSTTATWTRQGPAGESSFGWVVAGVGDVNNDGHDDVAVGAPDASPAGRVYLYLGSPGGIGAAPAWTRSGGQTGDSFGSSVAPAQDVNGDGYDDFLVGAPSDSGSGRTYLFLGGPGGPGGPGASPAWTGIMGDQAGSLSGYSVASAGDYDGNGTPDLIVGTPGFNTGSTPAAGRVDLVLEVCLVGSVGDSDGDGVCAGDNCSTVANPSQADLDADGLGDVCDCAPTLPGTPAPDTVAPGLSAAGTPPGAATEFAWPAAAAAAHYNVYRGTIPSDHMGSRGTGAYDHACFESGDGFGDGAMLTTDADIPAPGTAYYYLVSGENACAEGPLGDSSAGSPRPNAAACPTPP